MGVDIAAMYNDAEEDRIGMTIESAVKKVDEGIPVGELSKWGDMCIRKSMMEDYEFCPLRFKKTWLVDEMVEKHAYIMSCGTRFHDWAEVFFDYCEGFHPSNWEYLIPKEFAPLEVEMAEWFIDLERRRYWEYVEEGRLDEWRPIARELKMRYSALNICGTMDRVDWWNKEKNEVAIIEYKTGFSFYQPSLLRQLAFYSIMWEESLNAGRVVKLIVINPRLKRVEDFDITERIISGVLKKLIKLRNNMREDNEWKQRCTPRKFSMCRMCSVDECGLYNIDD